MSDKDEGLEHSNIMGGSTAAQRIYCPGSYNLEKDIPALKETEYAIQGTALHKAMEFILLELDVDDCLYDMVVGKTFYGVEITNEHVETKLYPALDAFDEICEQHGGCVDIVVEYRGSFEQFIPGAFGTGDVLARMADGVFLVLDWKFGDGVTVQVENNMQQGFYAACAVYSDDQRVKDLVYGTDPEAPKTPSMVEDTLKILFAIVQPKYDTLDKPYQTWETNIPWINDFIRLAVKAYETAQLEDAPLRAGSHCQFCEATPVCPLKRGLVDEVLLKTPESMDAVTLGAMLDKADELKHWMRKVSDRAYQELDEGAAIPGYKLVNKRGRRKYIDKEKASRALVRQLKTKGAYEPRKPISPAQAEKKLGKKKYQKIMAKYVTSESSGTTIAHETDKREAIVTDARDLSDNEKQILSNKSGIFNKQD